MPEGEVKLVRPDGQESPSYGELWVRNPGVTPGYYRLPEVDRERIRNGWLKTGDVFDRDAQGFFYFKGRTDDMFNSGGENVYPLEVENVLAAHPLLAEVAVIGVPHERWGETVKAIVVARAGAKLDQNDVIGFARQRLAGFKCPTSVDFVATLPRTATGKVLKHVLREPYWHGYDRRIN